MSKWFGDLGLRSRDQVRQRLGSIGQLEVCLAHDRRSIKRLQALRYKIGSRFTEAVMRELVHRGRGLRVQGEREGADAVIEGVIRGFNFGGVLLDDKGRARIFEVTITAAVTVRDQSENKVLYDNQNFVFRGEYEFASDPRSFFNEEDPAILRMSRSFAESIVSTLINAVEINKK